MKKIMVMIITVCLAISLVGCDALQRKFTRKKKAAPKRPRIYQLKKYEKKPTPELYNKHFVYWQTWSGEIIQVLGDNHKKDMRCMEEIVGNLKDMQNILIAEKADGLQKHIERAEDVRTTISRGDMSFSVKANVKITLEREDRAIKRDFVTSKIKNYIKKSFDEDVPELGNAPGPELEMSQVTTEDPNIEAPSTDDQAKE